jgi:oxygen-dependent protoporphyrinogen oxidase
MRIVVIGAGITGLTLGYRLIERARANGSAPGVTVLEAGDHAGGHATTIREDGFLVETGPNGFLDRYLEPQTRALVQELGLGPRLLEARPESKRRFVLIGGKLRQVPEGPPSLIRTDILSTGGKLRLLLEPFARPAVPGVDETVYEFAARRIGREAAENLVDAAVSGISAGDSRELSVQAAFPIMTDMEREHGSLIKAMIARRRQPVPRIYSFDGGLATLTGTLAGRIGPALRLGATVEALAPVNGAWRVTLAGGEEIAADRVMLTIASHRAADLVRSFDPMLAGELDDFTFAGLALVALAYRERDLPRPLDGYGYLVARGEGLDTLGVVWESSLFEGRAPQGMALLRCMVGGMRHPDVVRLPEAELVARARRELAQVMGLDAEPARVWVRPWPRAIAQYTRGHLLRVANVRALASQRAGLDLVGTSYDGISFTAAVASAEKWAQRIVEEIGASNEPMGKGAFRDAPAAAPA